MARPVIITGAFRSGTSLVAAVVNRLGWHVAPTIPTPGPPSWRSDWEDASLTRHLMVGEHVEWRFYLANRRALAATLGFRGFALKSPYLASHWEPMMAALRANGIEDPLVIRLRRTERDRRRSLEAHRALLELGHDERIIDATRAISDDVDLDIDYDFAIRYPHLVVTDLANRLDVAHDAEAIDAAVNLIGKPTEYALCPQ